MTMPGPIRSSERLEPRLLSRAPGASRDVGAYAPLLGPSPAPWQTPRKPTAHADRGAANSPTVAPATYNWNGFYAGGQMGYAWGTSNWTASSPGRRRLRLAQSRAADRHLRRDRKLLRRLASRLQLHAAEPHRPRRRGRRIVPDLSGSGRHLDRRHRTSPRRRSARKPMARRCWRPAPCAAASVTRPATGCSTRPAASPGPTTSSR